MNSELTSYLLGDTLVPPRGEHMHEQSKVSRAIQRIFQEKALPYIALSAVIATALSHLGAEEAGEIYKKTHAVCETLASFFEAIFIAAFLALIVDPVLKRDLIREGLRGMFRYVYGFYMPDEVQKFWDDRVVRQTIIRKDYIIHWHISSIPNTDRVSVKLHMEFKPVNFTGQPHFFVHKVAATADAPGETGHVESMYAFSSEPKEQYHYRGIEELQPHRDSADFAGKPIHLPAFSDKTKVVTCGAHYLSEGSAYFGTDRVAFSQLSSNVRVRVCVTSDLVDLKLSLIPSKEDDLGPKDPKLSPVDQEYCCEWALDQLFIPNERLVLRWERP